MSAWSATGNATPVAAVPGQVFGLVPAPGDTEVALAWEQPADNGASISGYDVQYRETSQSWSSSRQDTVSAETATITGLTNGDIYFFRVRGTNSAGDGPFSSPVTATPSADVLDRDVPDAPGTPSATEGNGTLDWLFAVPRDNGAQITGYRVQQREVGQGWPANSVAVSTNSYEATGLDNGDTYQLRARAINSEGNGAWSSTGSATPEATVPGRVEARVATRDQGLYVEWDEPDDGGQTISGYDVQYDDNNSFSSPTTRRVTGTDRLITGLTNGDTYYVRVRAVNSEGNGAWSDTLDAVPTTGVYRFTASQSWSWPFRGVSAARVIVRSGNGGGGGGGGGGGAVEGRNQRGGRR